MILCEQLLHTELSVLFIRIKGKGTLTFLFAAHQPAVSAQAVGDHLESIGFKFYALFFLKGGRCLTKPDTALLIEILVTKTENCFVDDDVLPDGLVDNSKAPV